MNEFKILLFRNRLINFRIILIKSNKAFIKVLLFLWIKIIHLNCKNKVINKIIWLWIKLMKIKGQNFFLILQVLLIKMRLKTLWLDKIHYLVNTLIRSGLDSQKPSLKLIILKLFFTKLQTHRLTHYNLTWMIKFQLLSSQLQWLHQKEDILF